MFDFNYQSNAIMGNQQQMNANFNNLQNQFTPGYKSESVNFSEALNQSMGGHGATFRSNGIVFSQGQIVRTASPTDLAINGNGFFLVNDGRTNHYTRDGRFVMREGFLVHGPTNMKVQGYALDEYGNISGQMTPISLNLDPATKLYGGKYNSYHFDESGKLYGQMVTTDTLTRQTVVTSVPLYQAAIGSFANPSGLQKSGLTTFAESENSGGAVVGVAGQGALGQVSPQSLEMANVDYAREAAALGQARMNYNANFASFRAMDKMQESAIGLIK
jgi:flagellar hook protein FlgE